MKAKELLQLYQDGKRDFRGENLRGQSFKGQNLSGADFSEADIRGANFRQANLKRTKFVKAKAGLQKHSVIGLTYIAWFIAGICQYLAGFVGSLLRPFLDNSNPQNITIGWILIAILFIFFMIVFQKGIIPGLSTVVIFIALAFVFAGLGTGNVENYIAVIGETTGQVAVIVAAIIVFIISAIFAISFAISIANIFAIGFIVVFAGAAAVAASISSEMAFMFTILFITIVTLLSAYISWQAMTGNPKYVLIHPAVIALVSIGGTSFREADLTDANFNQAYLKSTDIRQAVLINTYWRNVRKLDRARLGQTYLQAILLRNLLLTGKGQGQTFDYQNLRGVNLQGAQLVDASFVAADLSGSNLQNADLSRAKLIQTQLDKTDLTGACLTGACLEDWGITGDTKLSGVRCEYVFMRAVQPGDPNGNPCRKPDNWGEVFADDDFAKFIQPIVDTLDLYHNQDIDPRAIAISFKKLAETHPDAELEIVAMEKRGDDQFLLRAKTAETADHSELNRTYFETYNEIKALAEQAVQSLMAEKDNRIRSLETMVTTALQRPNFYAETYQQQGDLMSDKTGVSINAGRDIGNVSGVTGGDVSGVVNLGEIQGTVNNAIANLPDSTEEDHSNLKTLLNQIQTAIATEPTLTEVGKAMALEQVQVLAEAGQDPQSGKLQQTAKQAMGMLKGIISGLTEGGNLVEACNRLLPAIANLLNLL